MNRRTLLALAALGPLPALAKSPPVGPSPDSLLQALHHIVQLQPDTSSAMLVLDDASGTRQFAIEPDRPVFIGSAVKTFILGQFLLDVESGKLSLDQPLPVGPEFWSPGGNVLDNLQGSMPARSVLEAMITHSDNTATDIAMHNVQPERVRQLIARMGLANTHVPDSTRQLFSWLAGAPKGVELGWDALMKALDAPGTVRPAVNNEQTMMSTAADMVSWYRNVLDGKLFQQPATLDEFRRISAMADAIPMLMPEHVMGYGKGGSIDWDGFHCFSVAGQMATPDCRATFSFTINWEGPQDGVPAMLEQFAGRCTRAVQLAREHCRA